MSKSGVVEELWKHANRRLESHGHKPISRKLAGELCEGVFDYIKKSLKKTGRFAYPSFGSFTVRYGCLPSLTKALVLINFTVLPRHER